MLFYLYFCTLSDFSDINIHLYILWNLSCSDGTSSILPLKNNYFRMKQIISIFLLLVFCFTIQLNASSTVIDALKLGNKNSELKHQLKPYRSDVISGGLNEKCRTLRPDSVSNWEGGHVQFTLDVNPNVQNYFTVKFWGNDISLNRLILFV